MFPGQKSLGKGSLDLGDTVQPAPELLIEQGPAVASVLLCLVEGAVGVLEQLVNGGAITREKRNAHRDTGPEYPVSGWHLLCQSLVQRVGDHLASLFALEAGDEYREFVSAKPGNGILSAKGLAQALGNRLEHLISGIMAKRVVDGLEVVNVNQNQSAHPV